MEENINRNCFIYNVGNINTCCFQYNKTGFDFMGSICHLYNDFNDTR